MIGANSHFEPVLDKNLREHMVCLMINRSTTASLLLCATALFFSNGMTLAFGQSKIEIVSGPEFHVSLISGDGAVRNYQSNLVPNIPIRACYSWRLQLSGADSIVRFTEEFTLPTEPDYWSNEDNSYATNVISKDRKTSVTKKFVVPEDG